MCTAPVQSCAIWIGKKLLHCFIIYEIRHSYETALSPFYDFS